MSWNLRDSRFVLDELSYHQVDGGGGDVLAMMVDARQALHFRGPVMDQEADVVRDVKAAVLDPCGHPAVEANQYIGAMLTEPGKKIGLAAKKVV